jgi:VanZ family protein
MTGPGLYTGDVPHPVHVKRFLRGIWFCAILVVIVASLLPANSLPIRALDSLKISDKIEHAAAYAVLAFLPAIHERRGLIVAAAVGAAALGVALEYGQLYSGWRDFEIGDMVADALGVSFGLAVGIPMRSTALMRSVSSNPPMEMASRQTG